MINLRLVLVLVLASTSIALAAPPPASQPGETLFGEEVNGLRLGINGSKDAVPVGRQVKVTLVLSNASDKPLQVLATFKHGEVVNYEVIAPDGTKVPYRGPVTDWDVMDYDKAVVELAPGKTFEQEVNLFGYDFSKPGKYRINAQYHWSNAKPPAGRKPAVWTRGPIWTGVVSSGSLEVTVGDGAAAAATSQPADAVPDEAAARKAAADYVKANGRNWGDPTKASEMTDRRTGAKRWFVVFENAPDANSTIGPPGLFIDRRTGQVTVYMRK